MLKIKSRYHTCNKKNELVLKYFIKYVRLKSLRKYSRNYETNSDEDKKSLLEECVKIILFIISMNWLLDYVIAVWIIQF